MASGRVVAMAICLVVAIGCAYIGNGASHMAASEEPASSPSEQTLSPSVEPSIARTHDAPATASPNPSKHPTSPPTPEIAFTPIPTVAPSQVSGLAASDQFWEHFYDTCFFGAFPDQVSSSLAEITRDSDVVLRGTLTDLYSEHVSGDAHNTYATLSIVDVLKGEPRSREPGRLVVQLGWMSSDETSLRSLLPAHDHLWFLVHESTLDDGNDRDGYVYHMTDYLQLSVLRDVGGIVRVIKPEWIAGALSRTHYPVPLEGTSFEALVERVRDLAGGASVRVASARTAPTMHEPRDRFAAC